MLSPIEMKTLARLVAIESEKLKLEQELRQLQARSEWLDSQIESEEYDWAPERVVARALVAGAQREINQLDEQIEQLVDQPQQAPPQLADLG
jgi:predicted  nucleic acid-binding Zn-ribbon protein